MLKKLLISCINFVIVTSLWGGDTNVLSSANQPNEVVAYVGGQPFILSSSGTDIKASLIKTNQEDRVEVATTHSPEDIILSVNGETLTWGKVDEQIDLLMINDPLQLPSIATVEEVQQIIANTRSQYTRKCVSNFLRNTLLAQKARALGISISTNDMARFLEASVAKISPKTRSRILTAIRKPDSYMYRDLENYQLSYRYRQEVLMAQVMATPEEIASFQAAHAVSCRAIAETNALMRPKMELWLKELRAGTRDFAATAEEFSDCGSSVEGGLWGEFERADNSLLESLRAYAFSAPTNVLSEVIETPYSYHIMKVVERKFDEDALEEGETMETAAPTSVVLAHIMLEKIPVPAQLTEEAAREAVCRQKAGERVAEELEQALEAADIYVAVPVELRGRKKKDASPKLQNNLSAK